MKKSYLLLLLLPLALASCSTSPEAPESEIPTDKFGDSINHWYLRHARASHPRYESSDYLSIAENLLAYQNEDGGWPKNLDWLAKLDPDSVVMALQPFQRRSTLDNRNIYPQVEYLSAVYQLTGDKRYRDAAKRAVEWMLDNQYASGGWRGWDVDAITFNDGCITGPLFLWHDILEGDERYDWVGRKMRRRIQASWERGVELILKTQYVRNGVPTVWAQQYDHETLQPTSARTYELPSLSAGESADVVVLLMTLPNPSEEVKRAIHGAVAWYRATEIKGKQQLIVELPEGHPDAPEIKHDRILVDAPDAHGLWARYYELERDEYFFCNRDGVKVYTLEEIAPERRVGYGWFGNWGLKVYHYYQKWLDRELRATATY